MQKRNWELTGNQTQVERRWFELPVLQPLNYDHPRLPALPHSSTVGSTAIQQSHTQQPSVCARLPRAIKSQHQLLNFFEIKIHRCGSSLEGELLPVNTEKCSDGKQYVEELGVVGGCSSVVIEHWQLKPVTWVRFPSFFSAFPFQPEIRI